MFRGIGRLRAGGGFSYIATLFASTGANGFWFDESDFSTLSQNSAGTTAVTAVEQPIGRMRDKSGNGNNATQATAANRMVLSARVNLLTYSEQIDNAAWTKTNTSVTADAIIGPFGAMTADMVSVTAAGVQATVGENTGIGLMPSTISCYVKAGTASWVCLGSNQFAADFAWFNVSTGAKGTLSGAITSSNIVSIGNGWYLCSASGSITANANRTISVAASDGVFTSPAIGSTLYLGGAQVEMGSAFTRYQLITTATSYDSAGFPLYAAANGTNQNIATTTGGGGTTGFFFCQVINPVGSAGTARTLFSDRGTNTGYRVGINVSNQLELSAGNGTAFTAIATVATLGVGSTQLVTAWDDGTNLNVQVGGNTVASVARPTVSAGTAATTIASDNGAATGFFYGNLYPEVYFKNTGLTTAQRIQVQNYCKSKAGL
jgi:hypothetical protein